MQTMRTRRLLAAVTAKALLVPSTVVLLCSTAAQADETCRSRLNQALQAPIDVSPCNLLVTTKGRVVGVKTEDSVYVRAEFAGYTTHYRLNIKTVSVETEQIQRGPSGFPITAKTLPDAKYFYYPFYTVTLGSAPSAMQPARMRMVCIDPTMFTSGPSKLRG